MAEVENTVQENQPTNLDLTSHELQSRRLHFFILYNHIASATVSAWMDEDSSQPLAGEKLRIRILVNLLGTQDTARVVKCFEDDALKWSLHCNLQSDLEDRIARVALYGMSQLWIEDVQGADGHFGILILQQLVKESSACLGTSHTITLKVMDFLAVSLEMCGHWERAVWIRMDMVTETKSNSTIRHIQDTETEIGNKWMQSFQRNGLYKENVAENKTTLYTEMQEIVNEGVAHLGKTHKMINMLSHSMETWRLVFLMGKINGVDHRKGIFNWILEKVDKPWWCDKKINI